MPASSLSSKLLPTTHNELGIALSFLSPVAVPGVVPVTSISPYLTGPSTLQGTLPLSAMATPSISLFIK